MCQSWSNSKGARELLWWVSIVRIYAIPRSRHNPKILGVDDAEIVGDRITELRPIPRNFFTQETERRIGELGASCVALGGRNMLVHHAQYPCDRVKRGEMGWDEVRLDRAPWRGEPFLH